MGPLGKPTSMATSMATSANGSRKRKRTDESDGRNGPVLPTSSHLLYFGSKGVTRRKPLLAATSAALERASVLYSPFFGAGLFEYFVKSLFPKIRVEGFEVIPEIAEFHRVFTARPQLLFSKVDELLDKGPLTKEEWSRLRDRLHGGGGSDVERAAITFVVSRHSFGGKLRSFACKNNANNAAYCSVPRAARAYTGVSGFTVRCEDGLRWLEEHGPNLPSDAVLFLDPPYFLPRNYYGIFEEQPLFDHERLCRALQKIPVGVSWFLCYNDHEQVRDLYKPFANVGTLSFMYKKGPNTQVKTSATTELLISASSPSAIRARERRDASQ